MKSVKTSVGEVPLVSGETTLNFWDDIVFSILRLPIGDGEVCNSTANPTYARVAAICYFCPANGYYVVADDDNEWTLLGQFWNCYLNAKASGTKMIGYNLFGFDLLFIIRRSWMVNVRVPQDAIVSGSGPYRNDTIIDLRAVWTCGMSNWFVSLNDLAKCFGLGEQATNKRPHALWRKNQREAVEQLVNDITLMHGCAAAMGVISKRDLVF
jgi:hypothetical protein